MKSTWHQLTIGILAFQLCFAGPSISAQPEVLSHSNQSQEKIYRPKEVTVKARISSRPVPRYTEEARRHRVSGTVVLEMVLRTSGEVTDITVISGLPHGLSESCIQAAQAITFEPAIKDDVKVSQFLRVEYGFQVY